MKLIGFYDYTIILTCMSMVSAVLGMFEAIRGNLDAAVNCLLFSGICDAFDGTVARTKKNRTEDEKNFGIQLDSICDVVSFGMLPAIIARFIGVDGAIGFVILACYCTCGMIRLAYFNVLEAKRQKEEGGGVNKYYHGLPITASSIILPIAYCLHLVLPEAMFVRVIHAVMAAMAFLFVLDFPVRKPNTKKVLVRLHLLKE